MKLSTASRQRFAFTLVELVIVVTIIAVLAALVLSGVMKAFDQVPVVQTATDIAQLNSALGKFMADFQLSDPPPSTLTLNETAPLSGGGQNAAFLIKMFGKNLGPTDWNGDGTVSGIWTLTGEQCLLFYATGFPNTAETAAQVTAGKPPTYRGMGFGYSKTNPAPVAGQKVFGPYLELPSSTFNTATKVWSRGLAPQTANTNAPNFLVYYDAYASKLASNAIAYFSSSGVNNAYTINTQIGATPYFTSTTPSKVYVNPNSYQIISAGKDHAFGNGDLTSKVAIGAGADDQANFSSSKLGAGQN